jgi:hypothetical protein
VKALTELAAAPTPAIAVWGALFACGCAILLGAAALAWRQKRREGARAGVRPTGTPRVRLRTELAEAAQEAVTLTATAQQAAVAAEQARCHSEHAQQALEVAERAYEAVQRAYELAAAHVAQLPDMQGGNPGGREVARAALAAYRRGDISVEDLRRVWLGASGWDARHEDAERKLLQLRARQLEVRRACYMASTVARLARQAEQVADVAAQALADEAMQAENEVANLRGAKLRRIGRQRAKRSGARDQAAR